MRRLRIALTLFVMACVAGGVWLGYLTNGGPIWLPIVVSVVLAGTSGVLGWYAGAWGEQLGRELRERRQRRN